MKSVTRESFQVRTSKGNRMKIAVEIKRDDGQSTRATINNSAKTITYVDGPVGKITTEGDTMTIEVGGQKAQMRYESAPPEMKVGGSARLKNSDGMGATLTILSIDA
jgi:hypothetical protein